MKNKILPSLIALFLIVGCKTKNIISESQGSASNSKDKVETVGVLKFDLIDYEIVDSTKINQERAERIIASMDNGIKKEIVFTSTKSVVLHRKRDGTISSRMSIYDKSNKEVYRFIYEGSKKYYTVVGVDEFKLEYEEVPEGVLVNLDKAFKLTKYDDGGVEIFGYKCDELEIFINRPPSIHYTSSEIPNSSELMGPLGAYLTGTPLKTISFKHGLKITRGAVEYREDPSMKKYLEIDPEIYTELSYQEYRDMLDRKSK